MKHIRRFFCFAITLSLGTHTVFAAPPALTDPASVTRAWQYELSVLKTATQTAVPQHWTRQSRGLVAHGGGGIDGYDATNSYEALVANYAKGHTVFELDLNLTTDDQLVAIHDWTNQSGPKSLLEFKYRMIRSRYTPMSLDDINAFMMQHKDVYIITDTKSFEYSPERVALQFRLLYERAQAMDIGLLKRVIPQIYNQEMADTVAAYPFGGVIYTLYASPDTDAQVVDFVRNRPEIKAVTMGPVRYSQAFGDALRGCGKLIYFFTLNDLDEINRYREQDIHGFYTDFVAPAQLGR